MSDDKLNRPKGGSRKRSGHRRQRPPRVKSNKPENMEMDAVDAVVGAAAGKAAGAMAGAAADKAAGAMAGAAADNAAGADSDAGPDDGRADSVMRSGADNGEPDGTAGLPPEYRLPPRKWFFTFMCMNIPIVGWIYLSVKAFGKKNTQLKDFARAYLLYKLIFLVIALVILGVAVYIGLDMLDKLLAYMEML